ncbi:MAG: tetratricopeptide repeat protein [Candidatus Marinarcus sp.]|uniref:tetratricopeptide repeat protein n=1 Tax=Candidatus Marinarcus sp. TaxID=3100987 RepID=UPI003AFF6ABE
MKILNILIITILITGCAIKENDNFLVKGLKHTINSPLYLGLVIETTLMIAIATPFYLAKKMSNKDIKALQKKAESNDEAAQRELADMYYYGNNIDKDYKKAFMWYEKSAMQNNDYSQNMLGIMYRFEYGVKKDINKSILWYNKSIEQGNIYAMNNLGHLYMMGDDGIEKNYEKALKLFTVSEKQGNDAAMYNLGIMYENGYGVEKNSILALSWYQKSSDKGNKNAKRKILALNNPKT